MTEETPQPTSRQRRAPSDAVETLICLMATTPSGSRVRGISHYMFRCPVSGENVQRWIDDDPQVDGKSYVIVDCPACGKLHFVNRSTRKLLGTNPQRGPDVAESTTLMAAPCR